MTTKELLDEYAGCYRVVDSCRQEEKYGKPCLTCLADINRMQEIEKELETSIRKEVYAELDDKIPGIKKIMEHYKITE